MKGDLFKESGIDLKTIKQLSKIFSEGGLKELKLKYGDFEITFTKESPEGAVAYAPSPSLPVQSPTLIPSVQPSQQPSEATQPSQKKDPYDDPNRYHKVVSPIVGTFYRAPSPGADPFVNEGDYVKPSDTLCIVEAMKVMNEIKAEVSGKVVKIMKKNEEPVKQGDVLFVIEIA